MAVTSHTEHLLTRRHVVAGLAMGTGLMGFTAWQSSDATESQPAATFADKLDARLKALAAEYGAGELG